LTGAIGVFACRCAEVAGLACAAVWVYILTARLNFGQSFACGGAPQPAEVRKTSVAAIIPARNEASSVAAALESLSLQRLSGPFRIIVVDDESEDPTAAIALRYATVIRGGPRPPGWTGKLWAVSQGVAKAGSPDYFLLTDADIVHAPDNLSSLLARAQNEGFDLVSYMVELRCRSFAERALIPAFVFFFFLLYPPHQIRNPRRRAAGAAGGCALIKREMLEKIGGIAAIKGELIDDCALASAVKRAGGRVWLGAARSARSIREYPEFADVARMISRTAFTQLRHSIWILAATLTGLAFVYLLPVVLTFAGHWYGGAAWAVMSLSYLRAVRLYRQNWLWTLALPAIAAFYMGCTIASAIQYWRGAGGEWKGRAQAAR
jgi:hopene-associated glycosyltransferase HpnB